jgi:hypothetical protein
MIIDGFPINLRPVIQPVDDWFKNRRLALAFETRCSGGKLMVCSIDMKELTDERIVSKQLLSSLLDYMNSSAFNPEADVNIAGIRDLFAKNVN